MKREVPYMSGQAPTMYSKRSTAQIRKMSVAKLESMLSAIAGEIYLRGGHRLIPLPPFILVRVIPKELTSAGGILLPSQRQNKPAHEGIVLQTYSPYQEEKVLHRVLPDGTKEEYIGHIRRECPVQIGQRVMYPYYEGVAHKILGDDYMLIRHSADQIKFPYCQILGVVDYEGDLLIQAQICELMKKFEAVTLSGAAISKGGDPDKVAK